MSAAGKPAEWFMDRALVAQLPVVYRVLAAYCRAVPRRRDSDEVPGMWRGWVVLGELRRRARLTTKLLVTVKGSPLGIDLLDPRALWALQEVRGDDPECRLFAALLRPGDSFLDIGANHGAYAMVASRLVGPTGRVLAFEPQPRLAALLRKAFVAAGRAATDVFEVACYDQEGTMTLRVPRHMSGSASLFGTRGDSATIAYAVRTAPLDRLLERQELPGRLVVKLDVEGSELAVIRGGSSTIAARQPPILVEVSPETSERAGHSLPDLIDSFERLGYRWFSTPHSYPEVSDARSLDLGRQHDVLALAAPPCVA